VPCTGRRLSRHRARNAAGSAGLLLHASISPAQPATGDDHSLGTTQRPPVVGTGLEDPVHVDELYRYSHGSERHGDRAQACIPRTTPYRGICQWDRRWRLKLCPLNPGRKVPGGSPRSAGPCCSRIHRDRRGPRPRSSSRREAPINSSIHRSQPRLPDTCVAWGRELITAYIRAPATTRVPSRPLTWSSGSPVALQASPHPPPATMESA